MLIRATLALAALPSPACIGKTDSDPGDADTGADAASDAVWDTGAEAGFVKIPASSFDMGSTPGQPCDVYGVHSVTLTHAYYLGVTEVTQGQFQAVMGYDPSWFADWGCEPDPDGLDPDDCPVELVSWYESAAYANALSDAAGVQECYTCTGSGTDVECDVGPNPYDCTGYRLATEAEWEGAARCGTDTAYAGSNTSTDVAWTHENSDETTHAAAGLAPNACGLHDMSGNVMEWTQDWYEDAYSAGPATDPIGAASGSLGQYPLRVMRGGYWYGVAVFASVSYREWGGPEGRDEVTGFRLARSSR